MKLVLSLCLSLYSLAAWADASQALSERLQALQTLSGEFEQTVFDKNDAVVQESAGHFAIKKPGYFFWQSEQPYAQLIIGTPDKLQVYDPDLEQLTVRDPQPQAQNNPSRLLSGDYSELAQAFTVTRKEQGDTTVFVLEPQSESSQYGEIVFHFADATPRRFAFTDKLQQTTVIEFSAVDSNQAIPVQKFQFEPPPGTDIIRDD